LNITHMAPQIEYWNSYCSIFNITDADVAIDITAFEWFRGTTEDSSINVVPIETGFTLVKDSMYMKEVRELFAEDELNNLEWLWLEVNGTGKIGGYLLFGDRDGENNNISHYMAAVELE